MAICLGVSAAAVPTGVGAYKRWRDANRRATLQDYLQSSDPEAQWTLTEEAEEERRENAGEGPMDEEWDEPFMRAIAWRSFYGQPTPELTARWAQIANDEARKWADLMPGAKRRSAAVNGLSWVNLGPTDAKFEFNGTKYPQVDSGRPTAIVVHPTNPDIVYVATSGGGVWKTFDFSSADPVWFPVTETIGNLATGGLAMDPKHPETLYLGLGDSFDVAGGQVLKTTDGGATWSAPVTLTGMYDLGSATLNVTALRIRTVQVDPNNTDIVLVGTNVGFFRSMDAGQSFSLVDLPNAGASKVAESVWSIVYTGQVGGVSRWALSGVYASSVGALPPDAGLGSAANPGDIWVSTDAGATWSSRKAAGAMPTTSVGRIDLAAGTPSAADGVTTVIYAQLAAASETASAGYWRSMDSGQSFTVMSGTLGNPTTGTNCQNANTSGVQAYYGQAIAVDPANSDNVIAGGVYCGVRTRNGTAASPVWENVSHWLPTGGGGDTATGRLPYVHADWHTMTFVRTARGYMVLAGTDGGLFASSDVFDGSPANDTTITWRFPNRGIVTHLFYSVSSGDETTGNAFVAYGGLQDNGTRFRDSKDAPTTFNQVIGGDGIGSAVVQVPGDTTYWASVQYSPRLCDPDQYDCNVGTNWFVYDPSYDHSPRALDCASDAVPFLVRLTNVRTATAGTGAGVLLATNYAVYRYKGDPFTSPDSWQLLGDTARADGSGACSTTLQRQVTVASATVDGVYGVPTNSGRFRVTSNCTMATPGDQCVWSFSNSMGVDLDGNGTVDNSEKIFGAANLDFPPGPTAEPAGKVFVASSVSPSLAIGGAVPDALGHVFITRDGGLTWAALKGNGTGFDLPNVPVNVIRFDPGDLSNNTLYAGTDIGMYRTTDGGQTWQRFGYGLPMAKVTDIFVSRTGAFLRISTYGRGLWEIHPSATSEKGVNGNGDFDRNQQIDFVDLLSTANRMGTTPATSAAPFYDWNQDQMGSVNAIDDADLSQLLTRYGGRP